MALLGTFIDSRTIAGLTAGASTSYAHGLGANPDIVMTEFISTLATSNTVAMLVVQHNASNVTVSNAGNVTTPDIRAVAMLAHSMIR